MSVPVLCDYYREQLKRKRDGKRKTEREGGREGEREQRNKERKWERRGDLHQMLVVELCGWVPEDDQQLRQQSDWFVDLQRLFLGDSGCQLVEGTIWISLDQNIHQNSQIRVIAYCMVPNWGFAWNSQMYGHDAG